MSSDLGETYDRRFFGGEQLSSDKIGFWNLGYWKGISGSSIEHAQVNLIETLTEFFRDGHGNVLDVACGKGASTKFLTKFFHPRDITGINFTERQLQMCREVAQGCTFRLMRAEELGFADETFDNILCLEAGFHFEPRQKFLEEAHRVLKRGGRLAMWDLICPSKMDHNHLPNVAAYGTSLQEIGFRHVRVEDTTEHGITAWMRFEIERLEREFFRTRDDAVFKAIEEVRRIFEPWLSCLVFAIK